MDMWRSATNEELASEIERIENVLSFVGSVDDAISQAGKIGPGGFAEQIGYKNLMGLGHTDPEPPLTPQEEGFMHEGCMANMFHQRVRRTPREPINWDDLFLAASRGVFQVGKEKYPCAYFAACAIARFWGLANGMNQFDRWSREKYLDPAKQPGPIKPTPPRAKYLQCRWYIAHLKHTLEPFDIKAILANAQLEFAAVKREHATPPPTPAGVPQQAEKFTGEEIDDSTREKPQVKQDDHKPGFLGLIVDEANRRIRREGSPGEVDLQRAHIEWHTFRVAWIAGEKGATDAAWKNGYPGDSYGKGPDQAKQRLKAKLQDIDLSLADGSGVQIIEWDGK